MVLMMMLMMSEMVRKMEVMKRPTATASLSLQVCAQPIIISEKEADASMPLGSKWTAAGGGGEPRSELQPTL